MRLTQRSGHSCDAITCGQQRSAERRELGKKSQFKSPQDLGVRLSCAPWLMFMPHVRFLDRHLQQSAPELLAGLRNIVTVENGRDDTNPARSSFEYRIESLEIDPSYGEPRDFHSGS